MQENKISLLIVLFLMILTFIFFWKIIINPNQIIYPARDFVGYYSHWFWLFSHTINTFGELPLWDPHTASGTTFIGNPETGMFYPLNLLFIFFSPVESVLGYILLFSVFIAGVTMFFLAKNIGLNRVSSLISAIVYMFGGAIIGRVYIGQLLIANVIVLMPLLFMLFNLAIRKNNLLYGILAGIVFALQLLVGHVQFAVYSMYILFLYFLFYILFVKRANLSIIKNSSIIFLFAILIAVGLYAIQLLPTIETSKYTVRGGTPISYEFLTSKSSVSFTPKNIITFILPDFYGSLSDRTNWGDREFEEVSSYFGIIPLIFVLLSIGMIKNKYVIFFLGLAILSLFLALGVYNPLFPYIHKIILFFDLFRNPVRFLYPFVFSVSILAGFGSTYLFNEVKPQGTKLSYKILLKGLFVAIAVALITIFLFNINKNLIVSFGESKIRELVQTKFLEESPARIGDYVLSYYLENLNLIAEKIFYHIANNLLVLFLMLSSFAILLFLKMKNVINNNIIAIAVIILVISDLWMFGLKYIQIINPSEIYGNNEVINFIVESGKNEDKFRVWGMNHTLRQNVVGRYGIEIVDEFHPASSLNYVEYLTAIGNQTLSTSVAEVDVKYIKNPKLLDLLNVKYLLTTEELINSDYKLDLISNLTSIDLYRDLKFNRIVYVYENLHALPRAFIVHRYDVISDKNDILNELKSDLFNTHSSVILEKDPNKILIKNNSVENVKISYYSPNKISLNVNVSSPGFLVLSQTWNPGWKAYDNAKQAEIFKSDYILMSIYIDEGEHNIEFEFKPTSFNLGLVITSGTLLLSIILIIKYARDRRNYLTLLNNR